MGTVHDNLRGARVLQALLVQGICGLIEVCVAVDLNLKAVLLVCAGIADITTFKAHDDTELWVAIADKG